MTIEVIMPHLGAVDEASVLAHWLVSEGDQVAAGQALFEAESDKATVEVEAAQAGTVWKLLAAAGEKVPVGGVVAVLLAPGEAPPNGTAPAAAAAQATPLRRPAPGGPRQRKWIASPRARRMAQAHGVELARLAGTGPRGRIVAADVEAHLQLRERTLAVSASPPGKLAGHRAIISRRMHDSHLATAPVTLTAEAQADALAALRAALRRGAPELDEALTYDVLLAVIVALALGEHPALNASISGGTLQQHREINIGTAVNTPRGLVVPVLRDVAKRRLPELAREWRELVDRALQGKSKPADLENGTFTITNLGMYRIETFTPIINAPQCAILGAGRIDVRPVVRNGQLAAGLTLPLSLTFDHRLVDGAPAAAMLQRVLELVETPELLALR